MQLNYQKAFIMQEGLNIIDECSIAAVLYEAKDAAGKDVTLTGVDINTSEYRVAEARLKDGTDKDEVLISTRSEEHTSELQSH